MNSYLKKTLCIPYEVSHGFIVLKILAKLAFFLFLMDAKDQFLMNKIILINFLVFYYKFYQ